MASQPVIEIVRPRRQPVTSTAYGSDVKLCVLGPVRASRDGVSVRLGGPKQRTVLAILIAEAGRTLSADALVEAVWGEESTAGSRSTLRTYLSNLRGELGELVVSESGGYRLDIARDLVDAFAFEDVAAEARAVAAVRPWEAAERLGEALAMWQGHPFADVSSVRLDGETRRLEELRLRAVEDRMDAELAMGHHAMLVPELEVLTTEFPLVERFRAQHMLALYRAGRQAEALRAFQKTRLYLGEELGIEPTPELRHLEQQILDQDATLHLETEPLVQTTAFLFTAREDPDGWEPLAETDTAAGNDQFGLESAVRQGGGEVFERLAHGVCAAFVTVADAVSAATHLQLSVATANGEGAAPAGVSMAIDAGEVEVRAGDYVGPPLNRCARLLAAGHAGQVLLSDHAHALLSESGTDGWRVKALGEHRIRGLGPPQRVFQLLIDELPGEFPPLRVDRLPQTLSGIGVGRTVRGYELRQQAGAGDFGVVYRAYQPSVGREVAVKVIRPEFVNSPEFVRRFESEAHLVAMLEHPHIVPLHDFWRDPDGAYLVTGWLRGGSLREALDRGPWDPEAATRVLIDVGSALSYAHRNGVVHRDLKPANVLLDDDGNAYVADFGIAPRLVGASDGHGPESTSPAYLAPEEIRGEGLSPRTDVYALGLLAFELLTGNRPPLDTALPPVGAIRAGIPTRVDAVIARAVADQPESRFDSIEAFVSALTETLRAPHRPSATPLTVARNPYKGLQAFGEADTGDFYGRDPLVAEVVSAVESRRMVTVVGPSGIGKSSLVRAGIIPAFAGAIQGSADWLITDCHPGTAPWDSLAFALLRVAVRRPRSLVEDLASGKRALASVVEEMLPPGARLVLLIDQFEEVFTLTSDEETRRRFLDGLASLTSNEHSPVSVLITLRADFLDRPLRYPEFGDRLGAGVVTLAAPSKGELASAIRLPAEKVGVSFAPGLVDRIVADVGDEPGGLPLLQYALTELFERRAADVLSFTDYEAICGVVGALGNRAEALYRQLDSGDKEAARQVFLRLVTVDESGLATRRRVSRRVLRDLSLDPAAVDRVLDRFGEARLLTFDRHPAARAPTVEVAHEALLSEWGWLRGEIEDRRVELLMHRRLGEAAAEWEGSGREASYALAGGRLEQFESLASSTDLALSSDEKSFLERSRQVADHAQVGQRRRRRAITAGFGMAAVVATVLAGVAVTNQRRAERAATETAARELTAQSELALDEDPDRAILLALEAVEMARPSGGPILASSRRALFNRRCRARRLDLRLDDGSMVVDVSPTGEVLVTDSLDPGVALIRDTETGSVRWILDGPDGGVGEQGVRFSPDGGTVAVSYVNEGSGGTEPAVILWDPLTGQEVTRLMGSARGFSGPVFSPDGNLVAVTGHATGTADLVTVWDASSGDEVRSLPADGFMSRVAFLPDGETLLVSEPAAERVVFYSTADGAEQQVLDTAGFQPENLAIDPAGERLAMASQNSRGLQVWDLGTGEQTLALADRDVVALAWSPDGRYLAYSGSQGSIPIVDVASGEEVMVLPGHASNVWGIDFTPAGDRLASAGLGLGETLVWDVSEDGSPRLGAMSTETGLPGFARFSADGGEVGIVTVDGGFERFAAETGAALGTPITDLVAFATVPSPDWRFLAAASATDGRVTVRDLLSGEELTELPQCTQPRAFSPDGSLLVLDGQQPCAADGDAAPSASRSSEVIEIRTGERRLDLGPRPVHSAAFNPDGLFPGGAFLAVLVGDLVEIHDIEQGTVVGTLQPGAFPLSLTFDPRGRYVAGGNVSGRAWVLDLGALVAGATAEEALVFDQQVHDGSVGAVDLTADGLLATAGRDAVVRLWDVATGSLVAEVPANDEAVPLAAFSPDGEYLLYKGDGPVVRRFYTDIDRLVEQAGDRATRPLTGDECRTYLDPEACSAG